MLSENERKHTSKNPLRQYAIRKYFESVYELLPDSVSEILNAGCGEGYDAEKILEHRPDIRIIGVDISHSALLKSREICTSMPVLQSDVTQLPFAAKSVDMVLSLEVLEHLNEPYRAIQEYKRLSRRYILVGVPNEPIFRILRMLNGMDVSNLGNHPEHIQHWGLRGFTNFLKDNELRILGAKVPLPFIWSIVLCEID